LVPPAPGFVCISIEDLIPLGEGLSSLFSVEYACNSKGLLVSVGFWSRFGVLVPPAPGFVSISIGELIPLGEGFSRLSWDILTKSVMYESGL